MPCIGRRSARWLGRGEDRMRRWKQRPPQSNWGDFADDEHIGGPDGVGGEPYAERLGIETLAATGVQGRGVLVDLAAIHGRDNARVGYDGLMYALEAGKAVVETGDFLCVYTGFADML